MVIGPKAYGRLHGRIVGRGAGFPHDPVAQIVSREKQVLRGGAHRHDLFDLRYLGLLAIDRAADDKDRRRAVEFLALRVKLLLGHRRQPRSFGLGRRGREGFARWAVEDDEAPGLEAAVIRSARSRLQQKVEVLRAWAGLPYARGGRTCLNGGK